jgi:hypothetical protein
LAHDERAALPAQRQHLVLERERAGHEAQDALVHLHPLQVHRGHVVLVREHARERFLGNEAELDQRVADTGPVLFRVGETRLELLRRDESLTDEAVPKALAARGRKRRGHSCSSMYVSGI